MAGHRPIFGFVGSSVMLLGEGISCSPWIVRKSCKVSFDIFVCALPDPLQSDRLVVPNHPIQKSPVSDGPSLLGDMQSICCFDLFTGKVDGTLTQKRIFQAESVEKLAGCQNVFLDAGFC